MNLTCRHLWGLLSPPPPPPVFVGSAKQDETLFKVDFQVLETDLRLKKDTFGILHLQNNFQDYFCSIFLYVLVFINLLREEKKSFKKAQNWTSQQEVSAWRSEASPALACLPHGGLT